MLLLLSNYRPYRHLHKVWGASRNMGKGGGQNSYFLRIIEVKKPSWFFFGGGGGGDTGVLFKEIQFSGSTYHNSINNIIIVIFEGFNGFAAFDIGL